MRRLPSRAASNSAGWRNASVWFGRFEKKSSKQQVSFRGKRCLRRQRCRMLSSPSDISQLRRCQKFFFDFRRLEREIYPLYRFHLSSTWELGRIERKKWGQSSESPPNFRDPSSPRWNRNEYHSNRHGFLLLRATTELASSRLSARLFKGCVHWGVPMP